MPTTYKHGTKIARAVRNAHIAYEHHIYNKSLRELGDRYDLCHTRVRKIIEEMGEKPHRPGRPEKGGPRYG